MATKLITVEKKVGTKHRTDGKLLRTGEELTGRVKWFNTTKGYGFIAPDGGGKDVFVHVTAVERAGMDGLRDNQLLTFTLVEGRDGRKMASSLKDGAQT